MMWPGLAQGKTCRISNQVECCSTGWVAQQHSDRGNGGDGRIHPTHLRGVHVNGHDLERAYALGQAHEKTAPRPTGFVAVTS